MLLVKSETAVVLFVGLLAGPALPVAGLMPEVVVAAQGPMMELPEVVVMARAPRVLAATGRGSVRAY